MIDVEARPVAQYQIHQDRGVICFSMSSPVNHRDLFRVQDGGFVCQLAGIRGQPTHLPAAGIR